MDMKQINADIPADLYKKLAVYCINKEMKKKEVIATAITNYLNEKEEK